MSRNGTGEEYHHCMQASRLLRIETDIAEMEARRREDVGKTMEVLKGMVGQLDTALGFFTTAKKQIRMLYARVGQLTKELERQGLRDGKRQRRRDGWSLDAKADVPKPENCSRRRSRNGKATP